MRNLKTIFFIFISIYFLFFFLTTLSTPLIADDYGYRWTALQGSNPILDAFTVAKEYYNIWGGRSIAHFVAHLMMWSYSDQWGFLLYALANTFTILIILFSSYRVVIPDLKLLQNSNLKDVSLKVENISVISMFTASLLILFMTINAKAHYQTIFWATGSAHYMWMYLLLAVNLSVFKDFFLNEKEFHFSFYHYILLFFAGLSYENVGLSLIAIFVWRWLSVNWKDRNQKKISIPSFKQVFPILVLGLGSLIMLSAPGNKLREKVAFPEGTGTVVTKIHWWFESLAVFLGRPEGFLTILIFGFILYGVRKYRTQTLWEIISKEPIVKNLGLLTLFMALAYIGHSGNFYGRKSFNVGWVFCLFLMSLLLRSGLIEAIQSKKSKTLQLIIPLILAISTSRWVYDYLVISSFSKEVNKREEEILQLKSLGQRDIKTYAISNPFGLEDLSSESDHWINTPYSKILELDSIKVINSDSK